MASLHFGTVVLHPQLPVSQTERSSIVGGPGSGYALAFKGFLVALGLAAHRDPSYHSPHSLRWQVRHLLKRDWGAVIGAVVEAPTAATRRAAKLEIE